MKLFKYLLISVLVLLGVVILAVSLMINTTVKTAIEQTGSQLTGASVTIDRVSISPFTGRGEVNGFKVSNPDGFRDPYAFTTDHFSIQLSLRSLLSNEIMINEIIIDRPAIFVEQKLPENNLHILLRNIRHEALSYDDTDKKMIIEYFRMSGASATLFTEIGGQRSVTIDVGTLELNNIGRGGGRETVEEVIQEIAEKIVEMILQDTARSGAGEIRDAIRGLFD